MYDKPQVVADRPRLSPEFAAGVEENWRQENEALMAVDEGVAQIVEALRRTGELENTLIVFMSDNGFMHGEHRALAEKVLPYEESIRIPLVMRGPGVPRGRLDERLVGERGRDVDDPRRGRRGARPRSRTAARCSSCSADPGAEWGRDILIENGNGANGVPTYRGIRTYRFLYVEHRTTGEYELYDLENDPYQLQSVDGHERVREGAARPQVAPARAGPLRGRRLPGAAAPHARWCARTAARCAAASRKDLRVQVRGSKRARLVHADVLIGRRRVERLLSIPTARGRARRPGDADRRGAPPADPPARPLPPPRAGGDGGRPQAHAGPRAAALPLKTRSSSAISGRR